LKAELQGKEQLKVEENAIKCFMNRSEPTYSVLIHPGNFNFLCLVMGTLLGRKLNFTIDGESGACIDDISKRFKEYNCYDMMRYSSCLTPQPTLTCPVPTIDYQTAIIPRVPPVRSLNILVYPHL
jgi:hypothetical protein